MVRSRAWRLPAAMIAVISVAVACSTGGGDDGRSVPAGQSSASGAPSTASPSAASPSTAADDGPEGADDLPEGARSTIDAYVDRISARIYDPVNRIDVGVIDDLAAIEDRRVAWLVADGLRFVGRGPEFQALLDAGTTLTGIELSPESGWLELNNHLLANDLAPPPGYREWKRELYIAVDATWAPFFDDPEAGIDWRFVSFGGVLADRRPFGSDETCQCIAALDDPPAVPASTADWLDDGDIIIAVTLNGETRAYPRHIMETHELVNDVLGGERIALAYCTLCGSGQAYRLDPVPDDLQPVVLRTSGLLHRSNKIMFDLNSRSMVDTFSGRAWSGPWREAGIELETITTVTSEWGEWWSAHPATTVMAGRDGGGADYPKDPLGDRDDGGPIFPIGDADPRLFPQTDVIGVTTAEGKTVAFPVIEARSRLREGGVVTQDGVTLILDGSGLRAVDQAGNELVSHQAFWFAWSQFNPRTGLWRPAG